MEKKTILIVHNYYQVPGGEDTVVANEKKLLEDNGHKIVLYTRNNSELKTMRGLKKLLLPVNLVFNLKTYTQVRRIIKENSIDVVHVHNTLSLISPSVYYAARSCGVPVVQTVHNFRFVCPGASFYRDNNICEDCLEGGLKCALKHNCYRGSRLQTLACVISTRLHRMLGTYRKINYICLTEFTKNKLLKVNRPGKRPVIREASVYIKPNFTFPNEEKASDKDYFLFIGRIEQIKGLDVLLEAFAKLPQEKLLIAGTGTELEKYRSEAEKNGCGNIEFLGFVSRDELNVRLAGAKAVIVASQWYETFGMIIAEAFSTHVPVITGDIGNIGALVDDGKTGIKFEYNSSQALVEAVNRFNAEYKEEWCENAYNEYFEKYSPSVNYKRLNEIYEKL